MISICMRDFLDLSIVGFVIIEYWNHLSIWTYNMGLCCCVRVSFAVNLFMQEQAIKKKYGGMLPKKPPLISKVANHFLSDLASPMLLFLLPSDHLCVCLKCSFETHFSSWPIFILQDHERAYFDSADWALGKVFSDLRHKLIIITWTLIIYHQYILNAWCLISLPFLLDFSNSKEHKSLKDHLKHSAQSCR